MSPYAKDIHEDARKKFLLYGNIGSGKTTLFRSIPGRKFLYMFDPAGLNSIKAVDDIYYEQFLPTNVSMSVATLKGIRDSQAPAYKPTEAYTNWEKDFENRLSKKWFTDPSVEIDGVMGGFDCIGFDSLSTLSDLALDRILEINNRSGKNPELSDYGVLKITLERILRNAVSLPLNVCFTAHEAANQDKLMRTVSMDILVTGQLKQKLPILFSDIYHCTADRAGDKMTYNVDTVPIDMFKTARCSMELKPSVDVTIPSNCPDPTLFGIGKILRDKGLWK